MPPASTGPWANSTPAFTRVSATCVNCWCTSAPAPTREDIAPALKTTLQKFEHQTGLATHLDIEGDGMPLPADVQVQVLHVVQEALSNVRKHAQAREVWVEVQQTPQWRVEVRDDGCGFDPDGAGPTRPMWGCASCANGHNNIGATVEVASVPGSGTCVVLKLPERLGLAA
jgi:two-component system nitrate/nitrite sensor histidine kinase NarX